MADSEIDNEEVIEVLNKILEAELAGVVRYTHYSLMVFGYGRIPHCFLVRVVLNLIIKR